MLGRNGTNQRDRHYAEPKICETITLVCTADKTAEHEVYGRYIIIEANAIIWGSSKSDNEEGKAEGEGD